jgi:peptidoglycan/LPS O-acetylase OafA/YrhL
VSALASTVRVITFAGAMLAFVWYLRGRNTVNRPIKLVAVLGVLVAVLVLITVTVLGMLQFMGSLRR